MCVEEEPGSPSLAIPAMTTSYTSLITDGEAGLGEALVLELTSVRRRSRCSTLAIAIDVKHNVHVSGNRSAAVVVGSSIPQSAALK